MSMFDVARYLSYSKSVDYFDGTIKPFSLQNIDNKKNYNTFLKKTNNLQIPIEKVLEIN